mmetsp:Transcript_12732/g.38394  ORF Transcript_12732/g.38394 Transcript_12732/m.38394 type:complete len:189 (-) Transcript_12732:457-1023(-)|eukprot:CAMPEP_0206138660 /NCGR_PEP_ID=MMETSP1473-20131121/3471_1 /ASSEMBLY_ACC=CAM_ASM_001109 /TAXON_ID=1461547 /ORGANISM="Stichococcus sp, Strain RCC1054" /LENGTH=188 /DNA_ID=CAMNT_0053532149 /DNA_START=118 /DNA_END=684 /DNA_ORIENTATION=+
MAGIKAKISQVLGRDSNDASTMGTGTTGTTGTHHHSGTTGDMHTGGVTNATGVTGGFDTTGHHHHQVGGEFVGGGKVIDSKTFTKTEDHEVLIEKKAYELEHRPVEKQYVVETRYVGEQRVPGAATELVGTEAREVEERVKEAPHGDRTVVVENVDVPVESLRQGVHNATHPGHHHSTTGTTGTTAMR